MENTQQTQQTQQQWEEELGALWKRKSQNGGQTYLAGHVKVDVLGNEETVKVVVFSNRNKTKDTQPDFRIYQARKPQEATASSEAAAPSATTETTEEDALL